LRLVEELDNVPRQYFKKLVNTDDIWEVRVQLGNNIFRLLGFLDEPDTLVLTNGFVKKTQKTPAQEIALAERRKRDYIARRSQS
jgi:phage-related protein